MKLVLQILLGLSLVVFVCVQIHQGVQIKKLEITPVCPVNAISMVNGKAVIDFGKCIGCRRCVDGIVNPKAITAPVKVPVQDSVVTAQPVSNTTSQPVEKIAKATVKAKEQVAPKKAHHVDASKCIGCGLCVANCPTNAITMVEGKAVIDKDKCINCGICVNGNQADFSGCPVSAISPP